MVSIGDQKVSGYPAINLTNQTHQTGFLTNPKKRPKSEGGYPPVQKKSAITRLGRKPSPNMVLMWPQKNTYVWLYWQNFTQFWCHVFGLKKDPFFGLFEHSFGLILGGDAAEITTEIIVQRTCAIASKKGVQMAAKKHGFSCYFDWGRYKGPKLTGFDLEFSHFWVRLKKLTK